MNISDYDFFYITTNIFDVYIIYKFMSAFFDRRDVNRQVEIISYALYLFVFSLVHLFFNIPLVTLLANVVMLFLISFNYETDLKKRILAISLIYIILISIESIVALIFGFLDFSVFSKNDKFSSVAGIVIVKILLYIAALFINNYKNIKNKTVIPYSYWFAIFFIPLTSLFIILIIIEMASDNAFKVISVIVSLLFVNFFVFYLYDKLNEQQEEKYEKLRLLQQNNYYQKQFELIKTSLKSTRSFKHDMKNHLTVLKLLVGKNEHNKALKHIEQMTDAIITEKEYAQSGNIIIDSILNFKLQEAKQHGISVSLELNIPEQLSITSFDMSVILGNLLDNAINACSKLEKEKILDVKIKYKKSRLIIKISNTYNGDLNYNGDKLITSNEDKENHGMGIKNTKFALDKYNGEMEIEHTEDVFTVILLMYLNDKSK
ncbi:MULTISPECIES: sensor histidine kinase [unclassified Sedimentibacter]|uniref:sensor histidine kinase n=1 Tax=unclassified Sedimentibacter TaxID=2649220 RepID=UPI0027E08E4F|nr:sensor histidine kinase [Sedimentibacter sp. MB35-C1]WMJ77723.1 GHKL domain-containing protein [Sedimentibacter sp. MB35-C1]